MMTVFAFSLFSYYIAKLNMKIERSNNKGSFVNSQNLIPRDQRVVGRGTIHARRGSLSMNNYSLGHFKSRSNRSGN
jgi:hypothetical protein